MKFEEVYGRSCCGVLGQAEAAEILGVSERTFRRFPRLAPCIASWKKHPANASPLSLRA